MFYNYNRVLDNMLVHDTHDFNNIKIEKGQHCFIIGHHVKDYKRIQKVSSDLLKAGYAYFNIFGEQADLWEEALYENAKGVKIQVEFSKVGNEEQAYNLAMFSELKSKFKNFVISDDNMFTHYLIKDVKEILEGKSIFSIKDWINFRRGYEFKYNNKDCIVSIDDDIFLGYLGNEKYYSSIFEAFRDKVFDGKSFYEVWREIGWVK